MGVVENWFHLCPKQKYKRWRKSKTYQNTEQQHIALCVPAPLTSLAGSSGWTWNAWFWTKVHRNFSVLKHIHITLLDVYWTACFCHDNKHETYGLRTDVPAHRKDKIPLCSALMVAANRYFPGDRDLARNTKANGLTLQHRLQIEAIHLSTRWLGLTTISLVLAWTRRQFMCHWRPSAIWLRWTGTLTIPSMQKEVTTLLPCGTKDVISWNWPASAETSLIPSAMLAWRILNIHSRYQANGCGPGYLLSSWPGLEGRKRLTTVYGCPYPSCISSQKAIISNPQVFLGVTAEQVTRILIRHPLQQGSDRLALGIGNLAEALAKDKGIHHALQLKDATPAEPDGGYPCDE